MMLLVLLLLCSAATAEGAATLLFDCNATAHLGEGSAYYRLATGEESYVYAGLPYVGLLAVLSFMMGMGKGGVPGSSTTSVAMNALAAPPGIGCQDISVGMGVPITLMSDLYVSSSYYEHADWAVIRRLLPSVAVGMAIGYQLLGKMSVAQSKLLIGCILGLILLLSYFQSMLVPPTLPPPESAGKGKQVGTKRKGRSSSKSPAPRVPDGVPAYARSIWFACTVGVVGGFATILTNSMGPMLNVFLLTLKLDPIPFAATRSTFFCFINVLKAVLQFNRLGMEVMLLGAAYGVVALVGVFVSKKIMAVMPKWLFVKLEYGLMTFASLKLINAGMEGQLATVAVLGVQLL